MPHFQSLQNFLPKAEDLQGSAEALFRLQDTYQLDALEMIKGDVKSKLFIFIQYLETIREECLICSVTFV